MATKLEKLVKKARALRDKGKLEKALKYYRSACEEDDCDVAVWLERGEVAERLRIDGEAVDAYFRAAKERAGAGEESAAVELAHKVLAIAPDHEGARGVMAAFEKPEPQAQPEVAGAAAEADAGADKEADAGAAAEADAGAAAEAAAEADAAAAPAAEQPADREPAAEAKAEAEPAAEAAAEKEADAGGAAAEQPEEPADREPAAEAKAEAEPAAEATAEKDADAGADREPAAEAKAEAEPAAEAAAEKDADAGAAEKPPAAASAAAEPASPGEAHAPPLVAEASGRIALEDISLAEFAGSGDGTAAEYPIDDVTTKGAVRAVTATLSASPLLSELDSELVAHLIDCGTLVHRRAGTAVFGEGESGTSLFLILDGKVAVERRDPVSRDSQRLATLRPGAFFGEMSLLTDAPRSATVRAIAGATLLEVSRAAVRELIDREPKVLKRLMRFFRARLVSTMLARSLLFESFTPTQKRALIPRFRVREIPTDQVVLAEGSASDGLYLVLAGELAAEVPNGGRPQRLGRLGPGDVFGEMSLLDGAATVASIRTESRSWVLRLSQEDFFELADEHPQLVDQLAAIAEKRRADNAAVAYTSIRLV